jgi:erythronate-4-phosphate dehydrogenase
MDTAWMERQGIRWCYAPGCNANSVSEYVTSALLCLANRHGLTLEGKTIGVVGVGNVGSRVVQKAEALGMRVLRNDPPKEEKERRGQVSGGRRHDTSENKATADTLGPFVSLDRVLEESDVVTLHVPLTKTGPHATYHMADRMFFERMKPGCIFFNCARGAALNTDALLAAMDKGTVACVVMDTWEGEPSYRPDLLERVDIGTPHIAGHSFEGKVMGTVMVYQEACRFLGLEAGWAPDDLLPPPLVPELSVDAEGKRDEQVLWEIVRKVYDVTEDDRRMRGCRQSTGDAVAAHFDGLRKNYPMRREFPFTQVKIKNSTPALASRIAQLGFQL